MTFVSTCFNALDNYGKTAEQLKDSVKLFVLLLGRFTIDQVRAGFMTYMERNAKMPTPADIINIIDPPPPPPWKPDWSYYRELKDSKRRGNMISPYSAEAAYMKKCEDYALKEMRDAEELES